MPRIIDEARIDICDGQGKKIALLILKPTSLGGSDLLEVDIDDAADWGEEPIQLLEESRYEYELCGNINLRVRQLPGVIRRSVLDGRGNSGSIEPGSYVGLLPLTIEDNEGNHVTDIGIEVRSAKLGYRDQYRSMLNYIADRCTDLLLQIRSPAQGRFRSDPSEPTRTIAQRFAFLRALLSSSEFSSAISRIVANPHVGYQQSDQRQAIERGFKPGGNVVRQIAGNSRRREVPKDHPIRDLLSTLPSYLSMRRQSDSLDTAENRFIKYAIESFDQVLADMASLLEDRKRSSSDDRLLKDVGRLRRELSVPLSDTFLRNISRPMFLPLGSPVLQRREGYREILAAWIRFEAAAKLVWKGGDDVYGGGKRNAAKLYEYWVYFKLLDLVGAAFGVSIPRTDDLIEVTSDGFGLKLRAGHRLLIEAVSQDSGRPLRIRFSYNQSFSRIGSESEESNYPAAGTWTLRMRPDFTLSIWPAEIDEATAERIELIWHIHFDAKYKIDDEPDMSSNQSPFLPSGGKTKWSEDANDAKLVASAKGIDFMTMHAYRDAIRRTEGAYVIYPGEASKKWRLYREILPGLGAFAVNPGEESKGLGLVDRFLRDIADHIRNRASLREAQRYHDYAIHQTPGAKLANIHLPELDSCGFRQAPPSELNVLVIISRSEKHLEWAMSRGWLDCQLRQGKFERDEFRIDYVLVLNPDREGVVLLRVISSQSELLEGKELAVLGCPGPIELDKTYISYPIAQENHPLLMNLSWQKAIDQARIAPYVASLEALVS